MGGSVANVKKHMCVMAATNVNAKNLIRRSRVVYELIYSSLTIFEHFCTLEEIQTIGCSSIIIKTNAINMI